MIKKLSINQKRLAFTLIEVLIAIGIISVLALISLPFLLFYRPSMQLSGFARELVSDLRYAQQLAVTEQKEHGMRISNYSYSLIKFDEEQETIIKTNNAPYDVEIIEINGFTNNEIKFNPYGAAKEAGEIILKNSKNENRIIEIKISGFVRIQK